MPVFATKAELAQLAGVSKPAISKMVRQGKIPVEEDGRIDLEHPDCVEYLIRHTDGAAKKPTKKPRKRPGKVPSQDRRAALAARRLSGGGPSVKQDKTKDGRGVSATISDVASRREIEMKKLAADLQFRELKNAQMEGRLVAREAMIRGVWNPIETFLVRLLSDGAKSLTARVYPYGKAGEPIEDAEQAARAQLSSFVEPLRRTIKRALSPDDDV